MQNQIVVYDGLWILTKRLTVIASDTEGFFIALVRPQQLHV